MQKSALKALFCYLPFSKDSSLRQVRVERSETTEPFTATIRRTNEVSHPARPTNAKKRPKGAFLLSAICRFHSTAFVGRASTAPPDTATYCRVALRLPGLRRHHRSSASGSLYGLCDSCTKTSFGDMNLAIVTTSLFLWLRQHSASTSQTFCGSYP